MVLRGLDAFMPEQLGDFFQRDALLQQVDGERVSEPVTHHVSVIGNFGGFKAGLDASEPRLSFVKTVVTRYRISLEQRQYAPSTINLRLAAVRRLAYEASDCGLLSPDLAAGIRRVKGARRLSVRIGDWLTADEGRLGRRIWCIDSEGAEKPSYDRCLDRLWPEKGRGCGFEAGRCSTPRRILGDCGFEWKRRSHTDRSGAALGKDGNRRMDNACRTHFRPTVPSHQQGRTDVGKWIHLKGDLVNR
jgi:hypothetical protein